jgi:anaerobic selenocysteine-containing dehydrogenase
VLIALFKATSARLSLKTAEAFPYILITGAWILCFFHSGHRMIPQLRKLRPDPLVEIHPDTAKNLGISDGQWVYIESPRGRLKQRARPTKGIDPRVVAADHGWWYPEIEAPGHGWDESNINILTDNGPDGMIRP